LADDLFRRVNWPWFLNKNGLLSMGWHPEKGFLDAQWDGYNEAMILYIMAFGSPTHPLSPDCWEKWTRPYIWTEFEGQEMVNFSPLFGHQYSHMYVNFKGIQDDYMRGKGIDYFENAAYFGGTYNASNKTYTFNISRHIQDLINNNTVDYGMYLIATGSSIQANRSVLNSFKHPSNKIKLNITYSKF